MVNEEEYEKLIGAYEEELQNKNREVSKSSQATSMFAQQGETNLIEYQLELDNILERVENLLRGKILKVDGEGQFFYEDPTDESLKPFNEFGVQFIMNFISFYLNRNTILSNYDQPRINKIMYDLGYELGDQVHLNSRKMGLDTPQKKQRYPLIVLQIVHMIESVYQRALNGEERESLRTARTVMQSDPLGNPIGVGMTKKKKSLNPKTWFGGI